MIREPTIPGNPATDERIRGFFTGFGWKPSAIDGNLAPLGLPGQATASSFLEIAAKRCSR